MPRVIARIEPGPDASWRILLGARHEFVTLAWGFDNAREILKAYVFGRRGSVDYGSIRAARLAGTRRGNAKTRLRLLADRP